MALFIKPPVTATLKSGSVSGWDCWLTIPVIYIIQQTDTVVSTVGYYLAPIYIDMLSTGMAKLMSLHRPSLSIKYRNTVQHNSIPAQSANLGANIILPVKNLLPTVYLYTLQ